MYGIRPAYQTQVPANRPLKHSYSQSELHLEVKKQCIQSLGTVAVDIDGYNAPMPPLAPDADADQESGISTEVCFGMVTSLYSGFSLGF